jgi:hypothetical protein
MTDSTIVTATGALRVGKRAGLAAGARRNADTEWDSRSVARFWVSLAVLLENPGEAQERALRISAADLDGEVRGILTSVLGKHRDLVADSDPALAALWNECVRVLLAAGDADRRTRREAYPDRSRTGR